MEVDQNGGQFAAGEDFGGVDTDRGAETYAGAFPGFEGLIVLGSQLPRWRGEGKPERTQFRKVRTVGYDALQYAFQHPGPPRTQNPCKTLCL